jgi:hypothetical protein
MTKQQVIELITLFYCDPAGVYEEELEEFPVAKEFVDNGFAAPDEEEDDFYVITDAGDEALYPHIRQFAEDLVTFMYDNEYECTDEEIQAFFKEKYEMADDETVTLLALFMCNKLYHFGWDAPKIFSSEKGWFRRLEQLEGDDEE